MPPILKPNAFYTSAEVAAYLKLKPRTIQRWIEAGQLQAYRFGRKYRIRGEDLERFLDTYKVHVPLPRPAPLPVDTGQDGFLTLP